MNAKATTFTINGAEHSVTLTAEGSKYEAFAIKGVRWFQKTYGNTYHMVYVSGLKDGKWVDLCQSKEMAYGYGDHYLVTACEVMREAGLIDTTNEYALSDWKVREELHIEHCAEDVKRKRDM